MKKTTVAIVLAGLCAWMSAPSAHAARHLKGEVIVDSTVVTLADMFSGDAADPAWANVKVMDAPAPGAQATVRSAAVVALAKSAGAYWHTATSSPTITISRAGYKVPEATVEAKVRAALPADKRNSDISLNAAGRSLVVADKSQIGAITIARLHFDPRSESFNATVALPDGRREVITGSLVAMTDVPVLTGSVATGVTIGNADIDWLRLPTRQVSAQIITNADDLVGMAARRALRPGVPLRLSDIQRPQLVKRGDIVTMTFHAPGITVTAAGRAMESGAKGDRIRIVNINSNRAVEATITGARMASVDGGFRMAANSGY